MWPAATRRGGLGGTREPREGDEAFEAPRESGPYAAHLLQPVEGTESPCRITTCDDPLRQGRADAGQRFQSFRGGPVDVNQRIRAGSGRGTRWLAGDDRRGRRA